MTILEQRLAHAIGVIWTSNQMRADLADVCAIGSRFAGTLGERRAEELVLERLHQAALTDVQAWAFAYDAWDRGDCCLELAHSDQLLSSAISLVGSPSTSPHGLKAEVVNLGVGTLDDFEEQREQIPGRFVVTSSGNAPGVRPIHRRQKYGWAVERGAAGFVYVNHLPGMLPLTGSLRSGRPGEIPAVGVSFEDGQALLRQPSGSPNARLTLTNHTRRATAENLIVNIPGQTEEMVIVSAHYDGHDISPSALDNGSGLVVALQLVRLLAPLAGQLQCTVRFVFFTVEEWGMVGSTKYVDSLLEQELANIRLVVNIDGTSGWGSLLWSLNGFRMLVPIFRRLSQEMGYEFGITEEITTNSDHFPFVVSGVPAVWLRGNAPPDASPRRFILTPADTLDKVLQRDMKESAMVACQMVLRVASAPEWPARRLSRLEVRAMLRRHGLEDALRAQGVWAE